MISRSAGDEEDGWSVSGEEEGLATIYDRDGLQTELEVASTQESMLVVIPKSSEPPDLLAGWDCDESSGEAMSSIVDGEKDLRLEGVELFHPRRAPDLEIYLVVA